MLIGGDIVSDNQQPDCPKLSGQLKLSIVFFDKFLKDYNWHQDTFKDREMELTNLAHEMIGIKPLQQREPPPTGMDIMRIGVQWQDCLLKREVAKKQIKIHEPLKQFIDKHPGLLNELNQVLGKIRKEEEKLDGLFYTERETDTAKPNENNEKKLDTMIKEWRKQKKSKY